MSESPTECVKCGGVVAVLFLEWQNSGRAPEAPHRCVAAAEREVHRVEGVCFHDVTQDASRPNHGVGGTVGGLRRALPLRHWCGGVHCGRGVGRV